MLTLHTDAYRPGTQYRPHAHPELHFSLVLSGQVREVVGGQEASGGPLSVVAKDAGVVHANTFGGGTRLARLTLQSGTLASLVDDRARAESWHWSHRPDVAAHFLRLVRRARSPASLFPAHDPDVVDLLAAFTARPANPARGRPPAWLTTVMDELRERWRPGTTVADVARRAGVHPVYLARCVRRWYGTSVARELRDHRLRRAIARIADSGQTVSTIAHETGFSDEAHCCRAVTQATGLSPGRYRALLGTMPFRPTEPRNGGFEEFKSTA